MKKLIAAVVVALVVAVAGYLVGGPYRALDNIRAGVAARDQQTLAANVDFPVLRENLKGQIKASFDKAMSPDENASEFQRNLSAMGAEFAEKLSDKMVDALITPAGMAKMAGRTIDLTPGPQPALQEPEKNQFLADARVDFESLNTVYAVVPGEQGNDVKFVLTRQGLNWRLTNILLPLDGVPTGAAE